MEEDRDSERVEGVRAIGWREYGRCRRMRRGVRWRLLLLVQALLWQRRGGSRIPGPASLLTGTDAKYVS